MPSPNTFLPSERDAQHYLTWGPDPGITQGPAATHRHLQAMDWGKETDTHLPLCWILLTSALIRAWGWPELLNVALVFPFSRCAKAYLPDRCVEMPTGKLFSLQSQPGSNHQFYHHIARICESQAVSSDLEKIKPLSFQVLSFILCPNYQSYVSWEQEKSLQKAPVPKK